MNKNKHNPHPQNNEVQEFKARPQGDVPTVYDVRLFSSHRNSCTEQIDEVSVCPADGGRLNILLFRTFRTPQKSFSLTEKLTT